MALVRLDTHTGFQAAFSVALSNNLAPSGMDAGDDSLSDKGLSYNKTTPAGTEGRRFTALSYDAAVDKIIACRGGIVNYMLNPGSHLLYLPAFNVFPSTWMHAVIDAESLNPNNELSIVDMPSYLMTTEGAGYGFCRDPNTGQLFQTVWDFYIGSDHGGDRYQYGYGKTPMTVGDIREEGPYTRYTIASVIAEVATDDVTQLSLNTPYTSTIHSLTTNYIRNITPGLIVDLTPNVLIFDDVAVFMFEDFNHQAYISVVRRGSKQWLGSRMLRLGHVLQLCPVGIDRGMAMCWATFENTSPLMAVYFHYDRVRGQLSVDSVETITTEHDLTPHTHTCHATYDSNRQAVVILKSDHDTFERYVAHNLCHPGRPSSLVKPVPISAVQAEKTTTMMVYTGAETGPLTMPNVFVSYGGASAGIFANSPPLTVNTDYRGIGIIGLRLASLASGQTVSMTASLSSYSTGLSASVRYGVLYGVDPMIISASASFTVSTGISAVLSTTTVVEAATILPGRPALQSDAVGAGTPQELHYPTSALNSPLVFELNPQIFTNIASELLTRPLYASQRTLTKTATVQFPGDPTDLEVRLTWMGGGDRLAMTWAFFAQLYNYFFNVPDIQNDGYIQWKPKDLNNHTYNILFTDLEVGGNGSIQLDNMIKAADGYVHETVTATFRIVSTVE
ncbi:MAG TPA: hypothetical protein VNP04_13635 [Alphaproteobacteria bacterium]|nr:hypothetical protein [Alphaproteobacteria bacterium]